MSALPLINTSTLGARPQVLIVEDEAIVALELRRRLQDLGYGITGTANCGQQALRLIEEHPPDLVLMDIGLAGDMSGTDVAKIIRERFPIPVVYLTAFSDAGTLERVKGTDEYGYVTKPFQPRQLDAVLQLALTRRKKEQQRSEAECRARGDITRRSKEELQQFTYAAGHDLQEPLRTVSCFVGLLANRLEPKLNGEERELLAEAQNGLARMSTLLTELVAYAQAGVSERIVAVPAETAFVWAVENLRAAITESGAVLTNGDFPRVMADVSQLTQVFQNLLSNAIKYRRPGEPPLIHVGVEQHGGEWLFSVRDNGIGFDPQKAEYIFGPFKRLQSQEAYPGTGIGLAICKKIIEAHHGRIWAESIPDEGSTFFFTLPEARTPATTL